jgi:hypothetical protein
MLFTNPKLVAKANLPLVMRTLGRSNAQTAMIYEHPSMEDVRQIVNAGPSAASPKTRICAGTSQFASQHRKRCALAFRKLLI